MKFANGEDLSRPICEVAFFEKMLEIADSHFTTDTKLFLLRLDLEI